MAAAPTDPETRRMLFYNAGRVAEHAGDFTKARALYKQSLEIREAAEVRSHLRVLERR